MTNSPVPTIQSPSRIPQWIKGAFRGLVWLLVIALCWYAVGRALAPFNAVKTFSPKAPGVIPLERGAYQLKTVSWNIAHARGPHVPPSLAGNWSANFAGTTEEKIDRCIDIGRALGVWQPDLVALNEVDFDAIHSGHENQARHIAETAGLRWRVEQRNFDVHCLGARVESGNALLSRWPITHAEWIRFPVFKPVERWAAGNHDALLATVELPGNRSLRVLVTHLEVRDAATRQAAARKILEIEAAAPHTPLLVMGDLNARPNDLSNAAGILRASGRFSGWPAHPETATTFPALNPEPGRWIDYSLATSPLQLDHHGPDRKATQSDHLPLMTQWTWP